MSTNDDEGCLLICVLAPPGEELKMAGNVLDTCGTCGAGVQRRPNTPPAEIMCECCFEQRGVAPGEKVYVTQKTLHELRDYWNKGRH